MEFQRNIDSNSSNVTKWNSKDNFQTGFPAIGQTYRSYPIHRYIVPGCSNNASSNALSWDHAFKPNYTGKQESITKNN